MRMRTLDDVMVPLKPASLGEWETLRAELLANLRFASSAELLKNDAPLNAKVFDPVEFDTFVVEKVIFQSLPGFYVTGSLYRPKDTAKKYPGVLNPHGHWTNGRFETKDLARIPQRCANLAMRGMVAFIYDMIGYNDSQQIPHAGFDPEYEEWNFGRFSLQTLNSIRAVDFIASLPYVDAERIGCTGCSGGGTQTYFLAALDDRIKCAAPINMASTLMQGGCICENQAFLRTKFNNIDYTATIAPRPLFMSGSDGDWTVRSETVEFPAMEHIYSLYGAADRYEHFYQSAPHCYNLPIRERVYGFFCRCFGIPNAFGGEVDMEFDLDAFKIGDIRPYVPAEGFIENEAQLFDVAKDIMTRNLAKLSEEERKDLRSRVFPAEAEAPLDIPYFITGEKDGKPVIHFGTCPEANPDEDLVKYFHCYNYAADTLRVCAAVKLLRDMPNAETEAAGKSAAVVETAKALLSGAPIPEDAAALRIPGIALVL